jgi:hypothetical protein
MFRDSLDIAVDNWLGAMPHYLFKPIASVDLEIAKLKVS